MSLVSKKSGIFGTQIEHFFQNRNIFNSSLAHEFFKKFPSFLFIMRTGYVWEHIWIRKSHLVFLADLCQISSVASRQSVQFCFCNKNIILVFVQISVKFQSEFAKHLYIYL